MHTAAVLLRDGSAIALNARLDGDTLEIGEDISTLFVGENIKMLNSLLK